MSRRRSLKLFRQEEKGAAIIVLTLAFGVLAGAAALVTDIGVAYVWQQRLAVVADAAALAGGQALHLGAVPARQTALDNAAKNGINPENLVVTVGQDNRSLSVRAISPLPSFFGTVLGVDTGGELQAVSRVAAGTPTAVRGAAPLAVRRQEFIFGQLYTLKVGAGNQDETGLGPGNFGALALGASGANKYRANLKDGYPGLLQVGDMVETKPGNMSGPTRDAIRDRLERCLKNCQAPCLPGSSGFNCPRLLLVPVFEPPVPGGGRVKAIRIVGFAAFYVESAPGSGNESIIRGRFVEIYHGGQGITLERGFGLRAAKLVE